MKNIEEHATILSDDILISWDLPPWTEIIVERLKEVRLETARTCAATLCVSCECNLLDTSPDTEQIKGVGPAFMLNGRYQHSVEYLDGSQYYWMCEADKMWKELE